MRCFLIFLTAQAHGLLIGRTCAPSTSIVGRKSEANMIMATSVGEEAKRAWLSRLDAPTWGKGAVVSSPASKHVMSEDEAKVAWLARLDVPTWGKAAKAVADIAKEASAMEEMAEACELGNTEECETLSSESEAKRLWLAQLDEPSWGAAAAAVSAVAAVSTEMAHEPSMSAEEIAKQVWLDKLEAPIWGESSPKASEAEAKAAWLARLDAPSWGKAAKAMVSLVNEASAIQEAAEACEQGDDDGCETLSREEKAKRAWLAQLDVPSWGAVAAAVSAVATQVRA